MILYLGSRAEACSLSQAYPLADWPLKMAISRPARLGALATPRWRARSGTRACEIAG
jgi:hypothetical protein